MGCGLVVVLSCFLLPVDVIVGGLVVVLSFSCFLFPVGAAIGGILSLDSLACPFLSVLPSSDYSLLLVLVLSLSLASMDSVC